MQIGPKIHVGGTLGKIGQKAKIGLGKLEEKAAPFVSMIPGVGPLMSAAIAAHGRVLDTSHGSVGLGDIAKAGVKGGIGGLVAGGAGKVLGHIPGISSLASHLPGMGGGGASAAVGGGLNDIANAGVSSVGSGALGAAGSAAGGSGIMGSIGSFLGSHGTQLLEGAEGVNAALQQKKANDLANRALGSAEGAYNDRAPLRQAGIAGMLQPKVPSIASLNVSGANPYAQKPSAPGIVPAGY